MLAAMYPPIPTPGLKPNFTALENYYQEHNETIDWNQVYYESAQRKEDAIFMVSVFFFT